MFSRSQSTRRERHLGLLNKLFENGEGAWVHFEWKDHEEPWVEIAYDSTVEVRLNIGYQKIDPLKHIPESLDRRGITINDLGEGLYQIIGMGTAQLAVIVESILNCYKPKSATIASGWIDGQ